MNELTPYNIPTPPGIDKYVVEVTKSGVISPDLIVCDRVFITDKLVILHNAFTKNSIEDTVRIRRIDDSDYERWRGKKFPDCDRVGGVGVDYFCQHMQITMPVSAVVNVFGVGNLSAFPQVQKWASMDLETANTELRKAVKSGIDEVIAHNANAIPRVEATFTAIVRKEAAEDVWSAMYFGRWKWKRKSEFIEYYMAHDKTEVAVAPLHDYLRRHGVEWQQAQTEGSEHVE